MKHKQITPRKAKRPPLTAATKLWRSLCLIVILSPVLASAGTETHGTPR